MPTLSEIAIEMGTTKQTLRRRMGSWDDEYKAKHVRKVGNLGTVVLDDIATHRIVREVTANRTKLTATVPTMSDNVVFTSVDVPHSVSIDVLNSLKDQISMLKDILSSKDDEISSLRSTVDNLTRALEREQEQNRFLQDSIIKLSSKKWWQRLLPGKR